MATPPNILTLQHRNDATQGVYRYVGATKTQVGTNFGSTLTPSQEWVTSAKNRVIEFQGELYAVSWDGVYRFNKTGGNFPSGAPDGDWSKDGADGALTFASPGDSTEERLTQSGLHVIYYELGGEQIPFLVGIYHPATASRARGYQLNGSTGVWSETGDLVFILGTGDAGITDEAIFQSKLHFVTATNNLTFSWDPLTQTFASHTYGTRAGYGNSLCVFNNELYQLYDGGSANLARFNGISWTTVSSSFTTTQSNANFPNGNRHSLFTDGTNMYAFVLNNTGLGLWECHQFDSALARTDITSTVIPAAVNAGIDGYSRFWNFADSDTVPGTQQIWLYQSLDFTSATSIRLWQWNGNGSLITADPTSPGGQMRDAFPTLAASGGERIWTSGGLDIVIKKYASQPGSEEIFFTCYGGGTGRAAIFRFNIQGETATTQCSLVGGSATGGSASVNGNQVENIDADGATEYSVRWDTNTDGVTINGLRVIVTPQVKVAP